MNQQEYYASLLKDAKRPQNKALLKNSFEAGDYINKAANPFEYSFQYMPEYDELKNLFPLDEIAGNGGTLGKAINIMNWITSKTDYNGASELGMVPPVDVINYSFGKGFDGSINCVNKAMLLSDCLLSIGIYSLPVWINNRIDDKDNEYYGYGACHVVAHVFIDELNKWVMLDPSFNSYLTDINGNILNLLEIAELYKADQQIEIGQYTLNGAETQFKEYYVEQFVFKCLFSIAICRGNDLEYRDFNKRCYLFPQNDFYEEQTEYLEIISVDDFLRFP